MKSMSLMSMPLTIRLHIDMTARQFFDLVVIMRKLQREYFRSGGRDQKTLLLAKDVERKVDEEIKRVEMIENERRSPRLDI